MSNGELNKCQNWHSKLTKSFALELFFIKIALYFSTDCDNI